MADNAAIDEVLGKIQAYPERHLQEHYFWPGELAAGSRWDVVSADLNAPEENWCGTTGCIAGWAIATHWEQAHSLLGEDRWFDQAGQAILGLTKDQADTIFSTMDNEAAIRMLKHVKDHPEADWMELGRIGYP